MTDEELKQALSDAYAARNAPPSTSLSPEDAAAQVRTQAADQASLPPPGTTIASPTGALPVATPAPTPDVTLPTPTGPISTPTAPAQLSPEAASAQVRGVTGGALPIVETGGGSSIPSQVNKLATTTADVTSPTKLHAPQPVAKPHVVAQSPAQTAGMPPEISPEAIAAQQTGLAERINNIKLAQDQNARGPQDIYAQQTGQVLDKQADFYNHSLDQIRAHNDRLTELTQQLQGSTGPFSGIQRSHLESEIESERNVVNDLVRNSSGQDPASPAYRANKLANIADMATAALSGDQRDDLTRATNDKILTTIKEAELTAWQNARAENDKSILSHAMTGKAKGETAQAYAGAGLARAQTEQTKVNTGYTAQGMAALGLLNRMPANGMTPEIEQAIGTLHPDLKVPGAGGIAPTPEIAKAANAYLENTDPLLNTIQNAVNFRSKNGFTVPFTKSNEEAKTMGANLRLAAMNDEEMKRVSPETVKMFEKLTPLDIGTVNPHAMDALQTYQRIKADQRASKLDTMGVKYWKRPTIFKPGLRG